MKVGLLMILDWSADPEENNDDLTRSSIGRKCGDGFECGHHVSWFRVERGTATCTLVLV